MKAPHVSGPHRNGAYWVARYYVGGKRRSKTIGRVDVISERQAEQVCRRLEAEMLAEPEIAYATKAPKLSEYVEWYAKTRRNDLSAGTAYLYGLVGEMLAEHFGGDRRIDTITPAATREWYADLQARLSPETACGYVRKAKAMFARAVEDSFIRVNPFKGLASVAPATHPEFESLADAEFTSILEACPTPSWRALFALCRWAGLRRGEALRLTWADVDWTVPAVRVIPALRGGRRLVTTKQNSRTVPVRPELARELLEAQESGASSPCAKLNVVESSIDKTARGIIRRAIGRVYSKPFHALRKQCESTWMEEHPVMTVCQWLGHSPTVAMKHYHKPTREAIERVTKRSPEIFPVVERSPSK